jgi:TetR/AcrR family transcriptional regulator, transcriptional repressor for nem operon
MSAASTRRAETRQRILAAAAHLFRSHGVDGIGVDAIMREAGLTHGGFYLHFPSKEALAAEVSQTLLQNSAQRWDAITTTADRNQALNQIVNNYLDSERVASGRSCALTTLCADVARRPQARQALDGPLRSMLQSLEQCLGDPEASLSTLSLLVGAVVLARIADDHSLAEAFLDAARSTILHGNAAANETERTDGI